MHEHEEEIQFVKSFECSAVAFFSFAHGSRYIFAFEYGCSVLQQQLLLLLHNSQFIAFFFFRSLRKARFSFSFFFIQHFSGKTIENLAKLAKQKELHQCSNSMVVLEKVQFTYQLTFKFFMFFFSFSNESLQFATHHRNQFGELGSTGVGHNV